MSIFGYIVYFKSLFISIALIVGVRGAIDSSSSLDYQGFLVIWMFIAAAIFSAWFGWWAKRGLTARFGLLFGEELPFKKTLLKFDEKTNGKAGRFSYQLLVIGSFLLLPIALLYLRHQFNS